MCGSNNCKQFGLYYPEKDDCCEIPSVANVVDPKDAVVANSVGLRNGNVLK